MDAMEKIEMVSNKNNGIITTKDATECGISRATLSNICKKGKIVRIANGQYVLKNEIHDELLSIVRRSEHIVFFTKLHFFFMVFPTELKTPHGNMVASYDLERTICDLARSRNRIDTETFLNALKQYSSSPKKDLNKLYT